MRTKGTTTTSIIVLGLLLSMVIIPILADGAYLEKEWESKKANPENGKPFGVAVHNIDDDEASEILYGTDQSSIYIYDGVTKDFEWDVTFSEDYMYIDSMVLDDVDADGDAEIVAALNDGWSGGFGIVDTNYQVEEYINTSLGVTHCVLISDVHDHAGPEILVGGGSHLYIFGSDGWEYSELWKSEQFAGTINALAIGDVDSDSEDEIIVGYDSGDDQGGITVLSGDLVEEWSKTDFIDPVLSLRPYKGKVYIGTGQFRESDYHGSTYIYNGDTEVQSKDMETEVFSLLMDDFDGDGTDEIIIGSSATVEIYDLAFTDIGSGSYISDTGAFGNLFMLDIDDDGDNEIITHADSMSGGNYAFIFGPSGDDPGNGGGNGNGTTNETKGDEDELPILMIGGGAVGLLLIVGIVVVMTRKKKSPSGSGAGGYSSAAYGGAPASKPKGMGKIIFGVILLILGAALFIFALDVLVDTPDYLASDLEDGAEEGTTYNVYGHLANETSFGGEGFFYTFEENESAYFISSEDVGDEGDEVLVSIEIHEGVPQATGTTNPVFYRAPGLILILIGVILLGLGASKRSQTKGYRPSKPRKGEDSGAGDVDISNLIAGPSGPGPGQPGGIPGIPPGGGQPPAGQPPMGASQPGQPFPGQSPMGGPPMMPPGGTPPGAPTPKAADDDGMLELPGMDQPASPPTPPGQIPTGPVSTPMHPLPQGSTGPAVQGGVPGQPPQQQLQQRSRPQPQPPFPSSGLQGPLPGSQTTQGPQPGSGPLPQGSIPMPGPQSPQPGPQGPPVMPQYQSQNWTCPNCQNTIETKFAFCTSCGFKRHG